MRLLELLKHPDHDVHERAILALISLGHQSEARRLIKLSNGEQVFWMGCRAGSGELGGGGSDKMHPGKV
jgi:hypothetical protein